MRCTSLATALLVLACGRTASNDTLEASGPPGGSGYRCAFACPSGERCEAGTCVVDTPQPNCPLPTAPTLVHGPSEVRPLLVATRFEDREYLIEAEYAEAEARLLVDLSTQEWSTLPPGDDWLQCAQHLDPCWTKQADELTVHFDYALESGVWTPRQQRTHRLPFEGAVSGLRRGDLIVVGQDKVARLDSDTGDTELLATFEPRNVYTWSPTSEPAWLFAAETPANDIAVRLSVAPLQLESNWQTLVELESEAGGFWLIPASDEGWFLFREVVRSTFRLTHITESGTTVIGEIADPVLLSILLTHAWGGEALDPGEVAHGAGCDGNRCTLKRLSLTELSIEVLDEVEVSSHGTVGFWGWRRLACDTWDVMFRAVDGESKAEYWVARMGARGLRP